MKGCVLWVQYAATGGTAFTEETGEILKEGYK